MRLTYRHRKLITAEMLRRHELGLTVIEDRRQFARLYAQVQRELFGEV